MLFRTTVINLDPSCTHADATLGRRSVGELSREELIALLEAFRGIDPIENLEADPEIAIEARHRYVIRSGPGRLLLYNPRNHEEPAVVLTAEEIIAELDGSALLARSRPPFAFSAEDESPATVLPPAATSPTRHTRARWPLAFAACALATWLAYSPVNEALADNHPPFDTIHDSAQLAAHQRGLAGVFLTGPQPGDKGIAITADGGLRIFIVNAKSAPSTVRDTFRIGRADGQLALAHSQPGGLIAVAPGNNTLRYCGETYTRLK